MTIRDLCAATTDHRRPPNICASAWAMLAEWERKKIAKVPGRYFEIARELLGHSSLFVRLRRPVLN